MDMPKCEMRTFSALEVIKGTKAGRGLKSGSILKNERYSFQVAYKVERQHMRRCSLRAESDISEYITLREEVLSPCSMPVTNKGYVLSYEPTMYPDILAPYGELGITCRKGLWQASWVTVSGGVPAGVHKLKFALRTATATCWAKLRSPSMCWTRNLKRAISSTRTGFITTAFRAYAARRRLRKNTLRCWKNT